MKGPCNCLLKRLSWMRLIWNIDLPSNENPFPVRESAAYKTQTRFCSGCISLWLRIWFYNKHWTIEMLLLKINQWSTALHGLGRPWDRYIVRGICFSSIQTGTLFDCVPVFVFSLHLENQVLLQGLGNSVGCWKLRPLNHRNVCLPTLISIFCLKTVYILHHCSPKTQIYTSRK